MIYLLDTHTLLWAIIEPARLSDKVKRDPYSACKLILLAAPVRTIL